MRDDAQDTNLSRRISDRRGYALSASTASAAPASTADGELSGRINGASGRDLSHAAASAAAAAPGAPFRRTRLSFKGPAPLRRPHAARLSAPRARSTIALKAERPKRYFGSCSDYAVVRSLHMPPGPEPAQTNVRFPPIADISLFRREGPAAAFLKIMGPAL